jgi:hypothetical protein
VALVAFGAPVVGLLALPFDLGLRLVELFGSVRGAAPV